MTTSLEDSFTAYYVGKHMLNMQLSNFTPSCLPKRDKNICLHRNLYINVHSNFIHNCLKLEKNVHQMDGP